MKFPNPLLRKACASQSQPRGFALIVTLSLMILLTVIAVGLLSLSSISLRTSSQGDAMQAARANARMALMLAIGDLQKQLGPDTRISTTADQITTASDGAESSMPETQRHWTGVYKSWPTGLPADPRPTPEFQQWLVSGDPTTLVNKEFAATEAGQTSADSVEIVTSNCVGDGDPVRVPLISHTNARGEKGRCGWWVSDLGTKGLIGPGKEIQTTIADTRADLQSAPGINLKGAISGSSKPFATLSSSDPNLKNVVSMKTSALLADKPENVRPFFHDFTAHNRGLLTNVRTGGFRKDLSMELERPSGTQPSSTNSALYKIGTETGINLQELWVYYNLHKEVKRNASAPFTTGGTMPSGTPHLLLDSSPIACQSDDEFHFKQPVIINYQLVLSLKTMVEGTSGTRLYLVVDPIITLWNPLDMPVVVPAGLVFSVKYWNVPYNLTITQNGAIRECELPAVSKDDVNFLSMEIGGLSRIVMKPGEVVKMSQFGNTRPRSSYSNEEIHTVAGQKGFNFGTGIAFPLVTTAGASITVASTDKLVLSKAAPNILTAGETPADGKVVAGGRVHSRHFSLVHHEYYIGKDRGSANESLGIGGMYLDYDFGNKRLAPAVIRNETTAGTKASGDRYNATQRSNIFKTFNDGRTIPMSGVKMPIMLFSFKAKTEAGSLLGTRTLARFNPKALHADFYDLGKATSNSEREWLPYEYTVEVMNGWKSANNTLNEDPSGRGYFGGGMDAANGTSFVTTHSVPREPLVSIAAFQHSFANGFDIQKPKYGYATLNAREPMLPQISHAIGNSMACPMIAKDKTTGTLPGNRPMADHSYLANQALWDTWFLSGIAPQPAGYSKARLQKEVAKDFFNGTGKLPVTRYTRDLLGQDPAKVYSTYFSGAVPTAAATQAMASLISVEGMFNVNSTSVEAWKSLLSACKERPIVVRDANGKESIKSADTDTPVAGLFGPADSISKGAGSLDSSDSAQWIGRRTLDDTEIDKLARAIVKEVRKRGPFISLADFINRRVGNDVDLARSGAIQSALDSNDVDINSAYHSRATTGGNTFTFKEAEQGAMSYGIPGYVKQADILTPLAPILSARSDTFLVRGYGEKTDSSGKVLATATCEAILQRTPEFVDSVDAPGKAYGSIATVNQIFGRRFVIASFRWLNPSEV